MNEKKILAVASVFLSIGALLLSVVLFQRTQLVARRSTQASLAASEWERVASGSNVLGSPEARNTIVVFTDYQCQACSHVDFLLGDVLTSYPGIVKIVVRNNPLRAIHPAAEKAAMAAICAGKQDMFASFHALLFSIQDSLSTPNWGAWAALAKVPNIERFVECMESNEGRSELVEDLMLATTLQLRRSPSIMMNGEPVGSIPSREMIVSRLLP